MTVRVIEGSAKSRARNYAVVVSRFNEFITRRLLDGCLAELKSCGVRDNQITVVWVPGAYEIPVAALKLARQTSVHAVICLGAVIRGETAHFDLVAQGAARGINAVAQTTGKPVIFGVLTTETVDQAYKRSEEAGDNKGQEAARAAVEMVDVLARIGVKRS